MRMPHRTILALALAFAVAGLAPAQTVTLKIAVTVPVNSSWDLALKRLAAEFDRISVGRVRIVYPQSLRNSPQSDIIQKMNLGVDGALLDTSGLADVYPGILALSMPCWIRNEAEFDQVLESVLPLIKDRLSERYQVLAIAKAGWIRFYSSRPVVYPEDLAKLRIATSQTDDRQARILQLTGAKTIKCEMAEMMLQLKTKTVDSFYFSPISLAAIWPQVKDTITYVSPFKVCPFVGAVLLTKSSWARVPADLRPRLEEAVRAAAVEMGQSTARLEDESLASLRKAGLAMPDYPPDADSRWNALYNGKVATEVATMFPQDLLQRITSALASARAGK